MLSNFRQKCFEKRTNKTMRFRVIIPLDFVYCLVLKKQLFTDPLTEINSFCRIQVSRRFPTIPPEDENRFSSRIVVLFPEYQTMKKVRTLSNSKCTTPSLEPLKTERNETYPFNRLQYFNMRNSIMISLQLMTHFGFFCLVLSNLLWVL